MSEIKERVIPILRALDSALRDAGVHDRVLEIECGARNHFTNSPWGTRRHGSSISRLCLIMVFGFRSPSGLWWGLGKGGNAGTPLVVCRKRSAIDSVRRFFGATGSLCIEAAASRQLRSDETLRDRLQAAEARFFRDPRARLIPEVVAALQRWHREGGPRLDDVPTRLDNNSAKDLARISFVPRPVYANLSPEHRASGYAIKEYQHGSAMWSTEVNDALMRAGDDWAPRIEEDDRFVAPDRRIGAKKLFAASGSGLLAFNGEKIGLRSDILLESRELPSTIVLSPCDYIDGLSTNEIADQDVNETIVLEGEAKTALLVRGRDLFCYPDGQLMRYADSKCSNHIATSILAFTSDGVPLLVQQLSKNVQSGNLIAPSGSGSLDADHDLPALQGGLGFGAWLRLSSERELREELGIDFNDTSIPEPEREWMRRLDVRTMLTGFAGLLHRAAKPEFFGLARIGCTIEELIRHHHYGSLEGDLSARLEDIKDYALPELTAAHLQTCCENLKVTKRERNSVLIEVALDMAIHAASANRALVDSLLADRLR